MLKIENEITKNFINEKIMEIKGKGDRKTIIEASDMMIKSEAEVIKQALIERFEQLKRDTLEDWNNLTQTQSQQVLELKKALSDYEEDLKQIEGLKRFKRIKLK